MTYPGCCREKRALQARADELAAQMEQQHRAHQQVLQEAHQDAAKRQAEQVRVLQCVCGRYALQTARVAEYL